MRKSPRGRAADLDLWRQPPLPRGPRFLAAIIDFLVLLIPEVVAYELIAAGPVNRWATYYQSHPKVGVSGSLAKFPDVNGAVYHFYIAIEVITAIYLIGTYLGLGATVGKLALGLRITRLDGSRLSVRAAVLRSIPFWLPLLVTPISLPLLFFQYVGSPILIISRPDRRALGDLLAGTMVIRKELAGTGLQDLIAQGPPVPPPKTPPPARSGHLPGWEPASQPPAPVSSGSEPPREQPGDGEGSA